jgi:hypothetical protein
LTDFDIGLGWPIDVRSIQQKSKPIFFSDPENPDVFVYKMPKEFHRYLYNNIIKIASIEDLIPDSFPGDIYADTVIIFGYPLEDKPVLLLSRMLDSFQNCVEMVFEGENEILYNAYLTKPASTEGYSGAPVFLKHMVDGKPNIIFGGILAGHFESSTDSVTLIYKPEEVIKRIK